MLAKPEISYTVFHNILLSSWESCFKKDFFFILESRSVVNNICTLYCCFNDVKEAM